MGVSALRRRMPLLVVVSLLAALLAGFDARAYDDDLDRVVTVADHKCSNGDRQEPGIQGDVPKAAQDANEAHGGYNCGLSKVGHSPLTDGERSGGNANMAWAGDCAYISGGGSLFNAPSARALPAPIGGQAAEPEPEPTSGPGVAVVDVSTPTQPRHVRTLRTPGATATSETLHAVDNGEHAYLVVGQYGNHQVSDPKPMDVYDVSNCAEPKLLETFEFPVNIHNLTISGNGDYVFATQPLQVVRLLHDELRDGDPHNGVQYLGNLQEAMAGPPVAVGPTADVDDHLPAEVRDEMRPRYTAHEAWPTYDGTKLYLGGQLPNFELFTIVDIEAWLQDQTQQPEIISQRQGRGHSVRTATIGGTPYVLHSEESVLGPSHGCLPEAGNPFIGPSQPWLTDISDETNPVLVSQFGLAINHPENCPAQIDSGVRASVHYHDVDDPEDTTFVMASMWHSGLRIFDVRDPAAPREVAYFNPGDLNARPGTGRENVQLDHAWGHVRYVKETGHIWLATASGGFWVLELGGRLRSALNLPQKPLVNPDGAPGTGGVELPALPLGIRTSGAYCTIPGGVV